MSQKAKSPSKGKEAASKPKSAASPKEETGKPQDAAGSDEANAAAAEGVSAEDTPRDAAAKPESGVADGNGLAADADADRVPADQRIAELEADLAAARDRQLRALAELENVRKRAERERVENARYGGIRLARDLLSAHDAFDRLFAAMDDGFRKDQQQFAEGVELIHREMLGAFQKHDIQTIVPERNEVFDPHFHQAMFKEIDDDIEPGRIVRVLEKGFRLGDRLLRAARVSLAEERVIAAKHEPPPSTPVPGESPDEIGGDPLDVGGAAADGGGI